MNNFSLEFVDENWNRLILIIKKSETYSQMWNNDNLISSYFKVSLKTYREILKSQFGENVKIDGITSLFNNDLTLEDILDAVDVARVTATMFGEEENKTSLSRWRR